ncbi:MAG: hypothetical protein IH991_14380 [Planctomycetes bacterium]|nr:hypothetical protein [Planctomycetota bacterium]
MTLATLLFCSAVAGQNAVTPGRFVIDPTTLHCLAFRCYIDGDDNADATVNVQFRKRSTDNWREALPLLRVHREVVNRDGEPFTCGNLFAGSILNLAPDTEYEVRQFLSVGWP